MQLLLVEDDPMIAESVRLGLESEGHGVDWVRDGAAAARPCRCWCSPRAMPSPIE